MDDAAIEERAGGATTVPTSGVGRGLRALALAGSVACMTPTLLAALLGALVVVAQVLGFREVLAGDARSWTGAFVMVAYVGVGVLGWSVLAAVGLVLHAVGLALAWWARRLGARALALLLVGLHALMLSVDVATLGTVTFVATGLARTAAERR